MVAPPLKFEKENIIIKYASQMESNGKKRMYGAAEVTVKIQCGKCRFVLCAKCISHNFHQFIGSKTKEAKTKANNQQR